MKPIYRGHRFPASVIGRAVRWYWYRSAVPSHPPGRSTCVAAIQRPERPNPFVD